MNESAFRCPTSTASFPSPSFGVEPNIFLTTSHFEKDEFDGAKATAESSCMLGRGRGAKRGREGESSTSSSSHFGNMDMEDYDELAQKEKVAATSMHQQDLDGKIDFCGKGHTTTSSITSDGVTEHFASTSVAPLANLTRHDEASSDCAVVRVGASGRDSDDENPYPDPKWYDMDYYKENGGDEIWGTNSSEEDEWGWDADAAIGGWEAAAAAVAAEEQ
jgi:hypothetical protein